MAQIHFSRYQPLVTSSPSQILGSLHTGYELSFNETTCSWKCRLEFKVYNTNNPQTKFEIKIYEVCWTASGYLLGLNTGATSEEYCHELEGIPEYYVWQSESGLSYRLDGWCLSAAFSTGHHVYLNNNYYCHRSLIFLGLGPAELFTWFQRAYLIPLTSSSLQGFA